MARLKRLYYPLTKSIHINCVDNPSVQQYNVDYKEYIPDRILSPLVLQPMCYIKDTSGVLSELQQGLVNSKLIDIIWYENEISAANIIADGSNYTINKTPGTDLCGSIKVMKNVSPDNPVTLFFKASVLDPRTGEKVQFEAYKILSSTYTVEAPLTLIASYPTGRYIYPVKDQTEGKLKAELFVADQPAEDAVYWWQKKVGNNWIPISEGTNGITGTYGDEITIPVATVGKEINIKCIADRAEPKFVNLIDNGDFRNGTNGWNQSGSTDKPIAVVQEDGNRCLKIEKGNTAHAYATTRCKRLTKHGIFTLRITYKGGLFIQQQMNTPINGNGPVKILKGSLPDSDVFITKTIVFRTMTQNDPSWNTNGIEVLYLSLAKNNPSIVYVKDVMIVEGDETLNTYIPAISEGWKPTAPSSKKIEKEFSLYTKYAKYKDTLILPCGGNIPSGMSVVPVSIQMDTAEGKIQNPQNYYSATWHKYKADSTLDPVPFCKGFRQLVIMQNEPVDIGYKITEGLASAQWMCCPDGIDDYISGTTNSSMLPAEGKTMTYTFIFIYKRRDETQVLGTVEYGGKLVMAYITTNSLRIYITNPDGTLLYIKNIVLRDGELYRLYIILKMETGKLKFEISGINGDSSGFIPQADASRPAGINWVTLLRNNSICNIFHFSLWDGTNTIHSWQFNNPDFSKKLNDEIRTNPIDLNAHNIASIEEFFKPL